MARLLLVPLRSWAVDGVSGRTTVWSSDMHSNASERWLTTLIIALSTLAVLLACRSPVVRTANSPSSGVSPDRPAALDPALDFNIDVTQGISEHQVRFAALFQEGKPVVLNFWAGNCPPCRAEMPDFQRIHELHGDRVLVFGLDVGPFTGLGSNQDGLRLLRQLGITYPAGTTSEANVVRAHRIAGMPTTVIFAPDGRVHSKRTGLMTFSQIVSVLGQLWQPESSG